MNMVAAGHALCVPGNHDVKLHKKLNGRDVQMTHGLAETWRQLEAEPPEFRSEVARFIDSLVSHYVLDDGRLVVAHAGMKQRYAGRSSARVRDFALYGETTGETDEFGLLVRHNWAADYRGDAHVVYGHTPVPEPQWLNRTINIDTGCAFGGRLTALRWPEKQLASVPALHTYAEPSRRFPPDPTAADTRSAQQVHDDVLDLADVTGKRVIETRLQRSVTIRGQHATAALEVMSRFAADPRWLIYLPPTMSPVETSDRDGLLEHPQQAFDHYRAAGVAQVICQEKHMGSRAVAIVCRDASVGRQRFGVAGSEAGIVYTRTGRRFFEDPRVEAELLDHVRRGMDAAGLWDELQTDWVCLDCELMPWSAKAQDLLKSRYAAVGAAAKASMAQTLEVLRAAAQRYAPDAGIAALLDQHNARRSRIERYVDAYGHYCWPVHGVDDLRLAPFHLLASEAKVHADRDHLWHMRTLARLAEASPGSPLIVTAHLVVDVEDAASVDRGIAWWESLTGRGGEGMVVKPTSFIAHGPRGLVQPAVKCRGPEYLRIIYGPEYDAPEHLARLRRRGLSAKRSLALREFALGIEALERFVAREPLRRVHECVFGVLAMESEPVDPRL